jgi:hypothetical protein
LELVFSEFITFPIIPISSQPCVWITSCQMDD